jgi:hypothetical protein
MQYASTRDLEAHTLGSENTLQHYTIYWRFRSYHAVSEGSMTSADDKRPEANQLIELKPHALQCHAWSQSKIDIPQSRLPKYQLGSN